MSKLKQSKESFYMLSGALLVLISVVIFAFEALSILDAFDFRSSAAEGAGSVVGIAPLRNAKRDTVGYKVYVRYEVGGYVYNKTLKERTVGVDIRVGDTLRIYYRGDRPSDARAGMPLSMIYLGYGVLVGFLLGVTLLGYGIAWRRQKKSSAAESFRQPSEPEAGDDEPEESGGNRKLFMAVLIPFIILALVGLVYLFIWLVGAWESGSENDRTFLVIISVMAVTGVVVIVMLVSHYLMERKLVAMGNVIQVEFDSITWSENSRSQDSDGYDKLATYTYYVYGTWTDPATGDTYVFRSKGVNEDPRDVIESVGIKTFSVYVDPADMRNYYFPLGELGYDV